MFGVDKIKSLDNSQISWALKNIEEEKKELYSMISNIFDKLKMYINPSLYADEERRKQQSQETARKKNLDTFVDQLIKHGAKPEDLKYITDR